MQRAQMPCRTASLMVHRRLGIDVLCLMLAPVPCREVASTLMSMGMAWVGPCDAEASGPLSCREGSQYSEEQGSKDDLGRDGELHKSGSWRRRL